MNPKITLGRATFSKLISCGSVLLTHSELRVPHHAESLSTVSGLGLMEELNLKDLLVDLKINQHPKKTL